MPHESRQLTNVTAAPNYKGRRGASAKELRKMEVQAGAPWGSNAFATFHGFPLPNPNLPANSTQEGTSTQTQQTPARPLTQTPGVLANPLPGNQPTSNTPSGNAQVGDPLTAAQILKALQAGGDRQDAIDALVALGGFWNITTATNTVDATLGKPGTATPVASSESVGGPSFMRERFSGPVGAPPRDPGAGAVPVASPEFVGDLNFSAPIEEPGLRRTLFDAFTRGRFPGMEQGPLGRQASSRLFSPALSSFQLGDNPIGSFQSFLQRGAGSAFGSSGPAGFRTLAGSLLGPGEIFSRLSDLGQRMGQSDLSLVDQSNIDRFSDPTKLLAALTGSLLPTVNPSTRSFFQRKMEQAMQDLVFQAGQDPFGGSEILPGVGEAFRPFFPAGGVFR